MAVEPALRVSSSFAPPGTDVVIAVDCLRRPDFIVRRTNYRNIVVDERLLTRTFPLVNHDSRVKVMVLVSGSLTFGDLHVKPGQSVVLRGIDLRLARFVDVEFVDLEWLTDDAPETPTLARQIDLVRAKTFADQLADPAQPQRDVLREAFDFFSLSGVRVPAAVKSPPDDDGPTESDRNIARAMVMLTDQLADQATIDYAEPLAGYSPRQLQRLLADFNARYGVNCGNWRDARNRARLQYAIMLLSVPELTVAHVARGVGFASPNALVRALATAGFPAPSELRRAMADNDPFR